MISDKAFRIGAAAAMGLAIMLTVGLHEAGSRGMGGFGGGGDYHGGGFGDGDFARSPSSFSDGGVGDRGADAGFGRDGYGSVHESAEVSNRTSGTTGAYGVRNAATPQQRQAAAEHSIAAERADWDNYSREWTNYYGNVAYDHGAVVVGTPVYAVPAGAYQLNYLGTNYWYASGAWYAAQGGQYVVVAPVEGAVVPGPPPSCSAVENAEAATFQCGGAYYMQVPEGFKVSPPPIGVTVRSLPEEAVHKTVNGVSYYTYGGEWYRPAYKSGSVSYKVVKAPA